MEFTLHNPFATLTWQIVSLILFILFTLLRYFSNGAIEGWKFGRSYHIEDSWILRLHPTSSGFLDYHAHRLVVESMQFLKPLAFILVILAFWTVWKLLLLYLAVHLFGIMIYEFVLNTMCYGNAFHQKNTFRIMGMNIPYLAMPAQIILLGILPLYVSYMVIYGLF